MDISTTPEFAQGYQWASDRISVGHLGEQSILDYAPDEARRRYRGKTLTRDWLFVGGVRQALADHGAPGAARASEAYRNWYIRREIPEKKRPPFPVKYVNIVTPGPFIFARWPNPTPKPWRRVLSALTPVMQSHGLRQKDIVAIESVDPDYTPGEAAFQATLDAAFAGDPSRLMKFWLYDWVDGKFVLVREPLV